MLCNRIDNTGSDVAGLAVSLRLMLLDCHVDDAELAQLALIAGEMANLSNELGDVSKDIRFAQQVLRIGRNRTPDRHLREAIRANDEVRNERKEKAAQVLAEAA